MTRAIRVSLGVFVCLAALSGCAGRGGARAAAAPLFPSEAEVERIAAAAVTAPNVSAARSVDHWDLGDPLPSVVGFAPHEANSPAGALLTRKFAGSPRVRPSAGMQCVAHEYGRFWLAHRAMPAPDLTTFLQARCGEPVAGLAVSMQHGPEPGAGRLAGDWAAAAEEALRAAELPSNAAIGIWSGEAEGESVVVVVTGERLVELEPIEMSAGADGAVQVRGRFLSPAGASQAYVTRGAYGFSHCHKVPGTTPPAFRFLCPVDAGDPSVMLEIVTTEPGRVLGRSAMLALLAPGKAAPIQYEARGLTQSDAPMPRRDRAALLAGIDGLRGGLGMKPLRLMEAQSTVAGRLLPHYVAAAQARDAKTADMVALGMMAGWQVHGGMLRDADFLSFDLHGSASMDRAVEAVLMTPSHRAVLLDPNMQAIALATQDFDEGKLTSALVTTYRFFGDTDYPATEEAFLDKLDGERAARGKPPVVRVGGNAARALLAARESIHAGGDTDNALNTMLRRMVDETQISMQGMALHTVDLESITFPKALLEEEQVQIDVDLSHHQPQGSPWGMFLVLILFTTD